MATFELKIEFMNEEDMWTVYYDVKKLIERAALDEATKIHQEMDFSEGM